MQRCKGHHVYDVVVRLLQKGKRVYQFSRVRLTEYDVDKDKSKNSEMLRKSGGAKGVPLIDVEGVIIKGYVPDAIKAAVEKSRSL